MLNSFFRRTASLTLVLLLPAISFAQATATIAGRVLDVANGSPMGFASVVVEDAASARQLSGTLTGENGRFLIQGLAPGSYKIRVTVAGFYPADAEVLVSPLNQTYDLGDTSDWDENIFAGYANLVRIKPSYTLEAGLRVEETQVFTNAFELGVARSWTGGSASAALYRRHIKDSFLRIFAIDDSNPNYDIVNRIFENAGNSRQTGVQLLLTQDVVKPWRLSGNINWFTNDIDAFETTLFFPTRRPFALAASDDATWDLSQQSFPVAASD